MGVQGSEERKPIGCLLDRSVSTSNRGIHLPQNKPRGGNTHGLPPQGLEWRISWN